MRVLIMAKEGNPSEAATPPTPEAMAEYQKFDQELVKAGVVLEAGRLHPSSQGKRVRFDGKKRTVIDGPFTETKELVAGYWLCQGGPWAEYRRGRRREPQERRTHTTREGAQTASARAGPPPHTAQRSD